MKMVRSNWGRIGLALLMLNEIRGAVVVAAVVSAWLKSRYGA